MALLALVALALLLLEDDDFVAALVLEDLGRDGGAAQKGGANPEIRTFAGSKDILDVLRSTSHAQRRIFVQHKSISLFRLAPSVLFAALLSAPPQAALAQNLYATSYGGGAMNYLNRNGPYNLPYDSGAAFGTNALGNLTTGFADTALGAASMTGTTTGSYNTATGYASLNYCNGSYNTADGNLALQFLTTGLSNVGVGSSAMLSSTTSSYNTAVGTLSPTS